MLVSNIVYKYKLLGVVVLLLRVDEEIPIRATCSLVCSDICIKSLNQRICLQIQIDVLLSVFIGRAGR